MCAPIACLGDSHDAHHARTGEARLTARYVATPTTSEAAAISHSQVETSTEEAEPAIPAQRGTSPREVDPLHGHPGLTSTTE